MDVEIENPKPEGAGELSASPQEQPRPGFSASSNDRWWRIADFGVFGLWIAVVGFILSYHEKWADEAQVWLIARDLNLPTIWFHELRYNGTPGLWHTILWVAQHWFHAPYAAMGVIGMVCAAGGVAFILWKSPFPRPLNYLLVFSYFIVYQYAVIARSYNLLPLLLFGTAYLYRDRSRPARMTMALILLANVASQGTLLAAALGSCYLIEALKEWRGLNETVRRIYPFCIAATILNFLFVFFIVKRTPDVAVVLNPHDLGAVLHETNNVVTYAFFDLPLASFLFLALTGAWCARRKQLLPLILSVIPVLGFLVAVYGRAHHQGIVFLAVIAGLWIAWPSEAEKQNFSSIDRMSLHAMSGLLACLFCVNIWDAAVAMKNDYHYPYSGSDDAATYLKQVGADKSTIFGYTYGMAAVQALFDRNILANIPTTYYHEGLPLGAEHVDFRELKARRPEYLVIFSHAPDVDLKTIARPLTDLGYDLVHFSDGYVFYKRYVIFSASYFIYRYTGPAIGQARPQFDGGSTSKVGRPGWNGGS